MLYLLDINGSRATVESAIKSGLLVYRRASRGGGQLLGVTRQPFRPLEEAIITDSTPLGTVYCYAAGHGSMSITALDTPGAEATAWRLLKRRHR